MTEQSSKLKRILIDCSYINFGTQPSGIPRVVLAYVEVGYEWGRANGIEVIPVVPTDEGVFIVRPVPGRGAPEKLVATTSPLDQPPDAGPVNRRSRPSMLERLPLSLFQLAFAMTSVLKLDYLANFMDDTRRMKAALYGASSGGVNDKDKARITVQEGDLMFSPAYWHDVRPAIYDRIRRSGAKVVILVHDVLPILFAPFYQEPWRYMFKDNVHATFSYADALFSVSNYTGDALREIAARGNYRRIPIITAYNGFEPLADIDFVKDYASGKVDRFFVNERLLKTLSLGPAPYVMVGSVEPKKAHIPAIRCFEAMWKGGFERNLVIIGRQAWMSDEIVSAIETSDYYGEKLFWFNDLNDFDLAVSYYSSHGLVFCSLSEGFGIPMVEASYFGKPTVVFDTPIAREIIAERGCYFSDAPSFIDRIMELEEDSVHAERSQHAQDLDWPTWSSYTPKVYDTLRDVYDGRAVGNVISLKNTASTFRHEETL